MRYMNKVPVILGLSVALFAGTFGCNKNEGKTTSPFLWNKDGSKSEYKRYMKLEKIDSMVIVCVFRRGDKLLLGISSEKGYSSAPCRFAASVISENNSVEINLLGIDRSQAFLQVFGLKARSEIQLPELSCPFKLILKYGLMKDIYKVERTDNNGYKLIPSQGSFTQGSRNRHKSNRQIR